MSLGYRNEKVVQPSRFKLILVQGGEDCGYTIGCGIRVEPLPGETLEAAQAAAQERICEEDSGLHEVEVAFIAECVELPIAEWRRAAHGE